MNDSTAVFQHKAAEKGDKFQYASVHGWL